MSTKNSQRGVKNKSGLESKSSLKSNSKLTNRNDFSVNDTPVTHHNLTFRQLGLQNPKKLKWLHDLLDRFAMKVKLRKMEEDNEDMSRINKREQWRIPFKIIAFVANRI